VVDDAVLATSHEANVRDVEVVLREPFADAMVEQPEAVLRVLINLLLNALSFSPPGGRIEVSLIAVDDRVCFGVRDEGPGVAQELKAGLFSSGESQRQGGAGIGLMHSYGLAKEHGGELCLVDSPRGAHFELSWKVAEAPSQVLPSRGPSVRPPASIAAALASLGPPPLEAVQPEERQGDDRISAPPTVPSHSVPPPPSLRTSFAGKRLLLLEDDDAVLEMVRFGLTARGADVLVASTAQALDALLEDPRGYDAALLDLSPLGSNPGVVLQRLALLRVPVVLISGSVTPTIGDLPFASWVHKPFALNELYEALLDLDRYPLDG
jgi:CheY-like chemotaxis protein